MTTAYDVPAKRNGKQEDTGLSALGRRSNDWPPRWSRGTGEVTLASGKKEDALAKREKELGDGFGKLNTDFKLLPWNNASFRVRHGDVRGEGSARYVDIDPKRLQIID